MSHPGIEVIRSLLGSDRADAAMSIEARRAHLEALAGSVPAPDGVVVEPVVVAGRPAERFTPTAGAGPGVVLFLHGGAYVSGSLATHRSLAGRLALAADRTVVNLDYRLAPEHPFPAAVDDAVAAVRELAADGTAVAVAGDSAGGGLALATLVALRDAADGPRPAAGYLISPWTDLTQTADTYATRAEADPMLSAAVLTDMAAHYLAGTDATDALASPLRADLAGLPPLRIDVGDAEVLLDDSRLVGHRADAAGVDAQVTVWPEMIHVFPAFPPDLVPEADAALTAAGAFLAHHLS